ncbi:hypothetical protein Tco_0933122, partial [Tanacetum coccineum]
LDLSTGTISVLSVQHNKKVGTLITPIRLTFGEEGDTSKGKGKRKEPIEEVDEDLKKPYKEVLKSPFTKRIIEISAPSHRMPTNLRIYDGSTDPNDNITHFVGAANQGEWEMPVWCRMFQQTLDGQARGCLTECPMVASTVGRTFGNETLPNVQDVGLRKWGYSQGSQRIFGQKNQMEILLLNSTPATSPSANDVLNAEEENLDSIATTMEKRRRTADNQGRGRRLSGPESVCGSRRSSVGKIELEVMFGSEGLSQRTMMKFTVVHGSSPYNIILGRTWMKELRAISSTTHAMMKFPTPRGIATLVPWRDAIFECKQLEDKQILREQPKEETMENKGSLKEENVMINPTFPDQKVTIGIQGRVCLAADGYGQSPKMDKSALSKCKPKYNSRSTKAKGPRSKEECGSYERS